MKSNTTTAQPIAGEQLKTRVAMNNPATKDQWFPTVTHIVQNVSPAPRSAPV